MIRAPAEPIYISLCLGSVVTLPGARWALPSSCFYLLYCSELNAQIPRLFLFFFIAPNTEPQMTERLSRGMHYARSCQGSFCWITWVRTLIDSLIISLNLGTVYCIRCFRRSFYFNVSATQNHILHLLPWSSSKYNCLDNIHHFP